MPKEQQYFQVPQEKRDPFIERNILARFPQEERMAVAERVGKIVENYEGQDINALSVLTYAAEKGVFEEFATRLETYYRENLQFRHPEQRVIIKDFMSEEFFSECYRDLRLIPQTETD
jgi:hypothetical protein